jgi:hypothetical protein
MGAMAYFHMIRVLTHAVILAASTALSACIVVPRTEAGYDPDCHITTHRMTLSTVQVAGVNDCSYKQDCVAIVLGLGVTAASAIVSGSIAIVGNVVYWGERQADCAAAAHEPAAPSTPGKLEGHPSA